MAGALPEFFFNKESIDRIEILREIFRIDIYLIIIRSYFFKIF